MIQRLLRQGAAAIVAISLIAATRFPSLSESQPAPTPVETASPAADTPAPEATSSTSYGDLQNLTYTATGPLTASFVDPENGASSPISAIAATVTTVAGAGVEVMINGTVVSSRQLGKRAVDNKTGETQYFYYGIPLDPGPNTLTAVPIGADGVHGTAKSITVYGPGDPAMIRTAFEQHLIADGQSVAPLDISVVNRWGHAAMPGARLKVTILRGDARFVGLPSNPNPSPEPGQMPATPAPSDNSSSDPGVGQVYQGPTSPGGFTRISLVGGMVAGTLELLITVGDITIHKTYYIDPYVRKAFVNGLVSVGAGSMPGSVDGDAIDDNGGARRERGALYASGKVGKGSLLTMVYESQNRLTEVSSLGPYTEDPSERPYQTYGDSSQLTSEDHSNDHLYARLDSGRNNLLWGQYTATLDATDVGSYSQFLSGLKGEANLGKDQNLHVMGFTARNDLAYVQQIISPNGLSTQQLNQPLQPNIVVDSDNILLTVMSRSTGQILSQTPLIRNVNYTIDYATGILRFINIPLPFDPLGNPQILVVQYQYQGPGVKSETTGGSLKMDLGKADSNSKEALQFGYVNDASGGQNFSMFTQELNRSWSNGTWSISHADTDGTIPIPGQTTASLGGTGQALAAHLDVHSGFNALSFAADKTSAGYNDPFGGLSTPGLGTYQGQWTRTVPKKSALTVSFNAQTDNYQGQNNSERDATVSYQWFLKKLTILTGLVQHEQSIGVTVIATPIPGTTATPVPLQNDAQTLAHASATYQFSKQLTMGVDEYLTLAGNQLGSTQPTQTLAQANYQFPDKGSVFVRELWSATPQATFANSVSALTTGVSATHTTEIGVTRPLSPSTTVTSQYEVDQTGDATNIFSTMGIDQAFKFNSKFGGDLNVQAADGQGGTQTGFTVFGITLGYNNDKKMHTTFSYQDRSAEGGGSTAALGLAGHLNPEISLVGTIQRAYGNGLAAIDDQVSLAYRPVYSDVWTSLFNYTRSNASDSSEDGSIGSVITFEELWRPWNGFEVTGKYAYKLDGDADYLAHTSLAGLRVKQAVGARFDVAAEVQEVNVPSVVDAQSTNLAVEGGYQLGNTARVAVGYNFSGGANPALLGHPVRKGFYITLTTLVDRIFGWGKN